MIKKNMKLAPGELTCRLSQVMCKMEGELMTVDDELLFVATIWVV